MKYVILDILNDEEIVLPMEHDHDMLIRTYFINTNHEKSYLII